MITVKDKTFELFIPQEQIEERVAQLAEKLNSDYEGKAPLLIGILNGVFIFAADLVRRLTFDHEIQFCKVSSYEGTETTGRVKDLIGLSTDIVGRDVIVLEDIVDTGVTMSHIMPKLLQRGAKSVEIACLLMKPGKMKADINVRYCAMEIPNEFIVGYGLDYDGYGRNYKDIYVAALPPTPPHNGRGVE